jgi:hypothetical protein
VVDDWGQAAVGPDGPAGEAPYARCGEARDGNEPLGIISQQLIAEYLGLQEQHNRFERLKEWLKRSLEGGAAQVPGPWRLELVVREQRALTAAGLIAALGLSDEQVRRLKAAAPARPLRCLVVRPGTGGR